jgi:TPR repeat protein
MHSDGLGVTKDAVKAVKWHRKAADQGRATAQESLGFAYLVGAGVTQDFVEAGKWFRKAAEQGNADAQNRLGAMYKTGLGVPQDYVLAHMWFDLAVSRFRSDDTVNRRLAEDSRNDVAAKMTPAQIAEAQRLAREWKPK